MNNNAYSIAAAVLIGGRSRRMGSPKEKMIIEGDGRTFLDKICDEINSCYPDIICRKYLSVRQGQKEEKTGFTTIEDLYDDIGPLGGLISVLKEAEKDGCDAVLLLACDMINYGPDEIKRICGAYHGQDILWARTENDRLQPLASIYSVSVQGAAIMQAEEKNFRMRDLAQKVKNIYYYESAESRAYENVNSMSGEASVQ